MDENVTAFVLATGFALAAALVLESGRKSASFYIPAGLVILAAVFHLGSRSGVVAVMLVIAIIYVAALHVSIEGVLGRIASLVVFLIIGFIFIQRLLAARLVPERVMQLLSGRSSFDDSGRSAIVDRFVTFQDRWWAFGVGYGADAEFIQAASGTYLNVHNQFWSTWVEIGLLGIVILAVIAWGWVRATFSAGAPMSVIALGAPVAVFAITLGVDKTDIFWFALGVTAAVVSSSPTNRSGVGRA